MIVFDLECRGGGHRFEGWFASSEDFASQSARGLVACPACGSADVAKALTAPRLARKGNQVVAVAPASAPAPTQPVQAIASPKLPAEAVAMMHALAAVQAEAIKQSRWVGDKFADESRAIHYGEREAETIHGQASRDEAEALLEEGILVAPLLIPVAPPDEIN
jgi:hypothetical protein